MTKFLVTTNGKTHNVTVLQRHGSRIIFSVNNETYDVTVAAQNESTTARREVRASGSATQVNEVLAPMPGYVSAISVKNGDRVKSGGLLCVIEAMKMENNIQSPRDAVISEIHASKGEEVKTGQKLFTLMPVD